MKITFTLLLAIFCFNLSFSQWSNDASVANNLVTSATANAPLSTVSDSAGGAFILYFKDDNLYLQRLNANGVKQFTTPVQVSQQYGHEDYQYDIMNDGLGNVIIAYYDFNETGIYVQKISAAGTKLWNTAGVLISNQNNADFPYLTSAGSSGVYIVWQEDGENNEIIKVQRVTSAGNLAWTNNTTIATENSDDEIGDITIDGQGGLFVIFNSYGESNEFIQGQHINSSGVLLWGDEGKLLVSDSSQPYIGYLEGGSISDWAIPDGSGGVFFIYNTYPETYITAQRVDNSGTLLWGANGIKANASDISDELIDEAIIRDGQGGINIYWSQESSANAAAGIYGQRIDANGSVSWTSTGLNFVNNNIEQVYLTLVNDTEGNVIFAWNSETALYAVKVNSITGNTFWNANGNPVCTVSGASPENPDITYSYPTGAIIGWNDHREALPFSQSVYAERITNNGVLPLHLLSFTASLQNKGVNLDWQTTQETNTSFFVIERSNDGVNYSFLQQVTANGNSSTYSAIDKNPLLGNNFYRLKMVDKDGNFTYTNAVPINYFIKSMIAVSPNPVINKLTIQLQSLTNGKAGIRISDVTGKTVYTKEFAVSAGVNSLTIPVNSFVKGTYFLTVIQDSNKQTVKWLKE